LPGNKEMLFLFKSDDAGVRREDNSYSKTATVQIALCLQLVHIQVLPTVARKMILPLTPMRLQWSSPDSVNEVPHNRHEYESQGEASNIDIEAVDHW